MLGNLQVVLVAFVAWAVLGERPGARVITAVPIVFFGAVLISGVLEDGAYGDDPARGTIFGLLTTLAYSGFILVLRQTNTDQRRPAGPLFDATRGRRRWSPPASARPTAPSTSSPTLARARLAGPARRSARRWWAGC